MASNLLTCDGLHLIASLLLMKANSAFLSNPMSGVLCVTLFQEVDRREQLRTFFDLDAVGNRRVMRWTRVQAPNIPGVASHPEHEQ